MTNYDYNNLPEELPVQPLPPEMVAAVRGAINEALEYGITSASEAKVAYVYNRKGHMNFTQFGEKGNKSYSSDSDDIIMQLTVRVENPKNASRYGLSKLIEMEEQFKAHNREAQTSKLEAEIAAEEAKAKQALESAQQKRDQLIALHSN